MTIKIERFMLILSSLNGENMEVYIKKNVFVPQETTTTQCDPGKCHHEVNKNLFWLKNTSQFTKDQPNIVGSKYINVDLYVKNKRECCKKILTIRNNLIVF